MNVKYTFECIARPGDFIRAKWVDKSDKFLNGIVTNLSSGIVKDGGIIEVALWDGELVEEFTITEEEIKTGEVMFETAQELSNSTVKVNFPESGGAI